MCAEQITLLEAAEAILDLYRESKNRVSMKYVLHAENGIYEPLLANNRFTEEEIKAAIEELHEAGFISGELDVLLGQELDRDMRMRTDWRLTESRGEPRVFPGTYPRKDAK
ncbi:MAG: hypothetical protein ISS70_02050 [Phycisphaerae bacterium]|nr:hypothetical protein [Phycisphaerae bacterium]